MKATVKNLENKDVGKIDLNDLIFGLEPRADILTRVVNWQLAKRRAGTHATRGVSEISGTGKKPFAQKGTGRARQGSLRSAQMRGGATVFGPTPRDHGYSMPKRIRKLALCMALSSKVQDGKLIVLDDAKSDDHKTKAMISKLNGMGIEQSVLIIDGANLDDNFTKSVRNIPMIDLLPEQGANVYDILRRDTLVLTKNAVEQLQERLK